MTIGTSIFALTFGIVTVACSSSRPIPVSPSTPPTPQTPQTPASWSDEFDGPANSLPDPLKWTYDLGGGGWGNQELETYTNSSQNVHLDGQGHLVIRVETTPTGYTSARIKTQGLVSAQYGRVEASIRLPVGTGIWPAFWMLGSNIGSAGWPQCGEIDVMENIGSQPSRNLGSMHGPGYSGGSAISAAYVLPDGQRFTDAFHTFAVQWAPQSVTFVVDGAAYRTVTPSALPAGTRWVFDAPFFVILNVAVGGNFPGPPNATTSFPQEMVVDYVRYTAAPSPAVAGTLGSAPVAH